MSITTWKKEFYPKPAKKTTVAEALDHSIRKWMGFLPENAEKHGLTNGGYCLRNKNGLDVFEANIDTCALCQRFMKNKSNGSSEKNCANCPLFKATGKYCNIGNDVFSRIVHGNSSLKILIRALKKARAFLPKE